MPRAGRIVIPGYPHHVVQRGVRSMEVFSSDDDRRRYLGLLRQFGERYGLTYWAWCLMSNHVHLVAVPATERSLALGVGRAHRRYTLEINERESARGHLFQERFYSSAVQDDRHLLAVARYVELNPVRAGLTNDAEDYRWSSASYHVSGIPDALTQQSPITGMVPDWKSFLSERIAAEESERIERSLQTGQPWGRPEWVMRARNVVP